MQIIKSQSAIVDLSIQINTQIFIQTHTQITLLCIATCTWAAGGGASILVFVVRISALFGVLKVVTYTTTMCTHTCKLFKCSDSRHRTCLPVLVDSVCALFHTHSLRPLSNFRFCHFWSVSCSLLHTEVYHCLRFCCCWSFYVVFCFIYFYNALMLVLVAAFGLFSIWAASKWIFDWFFG